MFWCFAVNSQFVKKQLPAHQEVLHRHDYHPGQKVSLLQEVEYRKIAKSGRESCKFPSRVFFILFTNAYNCFYKVFSQKRSDIADWYHG